MELWVSGKHLKPVHKLVDPFEDKFSSWVERAVRIRHLPLMIRIA